MSSDHTRVDAPGPAANSRSAASSNIAGGSISDLVVALGDITGGNRTEDIEQARLLDHIFEHSLDCVVLLDKDYNFIRVSKSYARVCARDVSEFPGRNHFDLYPSSLKDEFDEAIRTGAVYRRTARPFTFPDHPEWGVTYWDLGMVPIRDAGGAIELLLVALKDVTERKRIEEALRESESRYRAVVEGQTEFIVRWLPDGTRTFVNEGYARYFGRPREECIGISFFPLIETEKERDAVRDKLKSLTPTNPIMINVHHALRADGQWRWQEWVDRGFFDSGGQLVEMQSVGRDIHERVETERQLRESERLLQVLVEDTPASVAMFDTEMRYLAWSKRWLTDYRLGERELKGLSHYEVFPEIGEDWKAVHRRCLAGATESRDEDPFPRADGRLDYVRWVVQPWHRANGAVGGLIMFTEVITERKRTESDLERARDAAEVALARLTVESARAEQFSRLIDLAGQCVGMARLDGSLTYCNPFMRRFLDLLLDQDITGHTFWDFIPPETHALVAETVLPTTREVGFWTGEFDLLTATGRRVPVINNVFLMRDPDGTVAGYANIATDVTNLKRVEAALRESQSRFRAIFDQTFQFIGLLTTGGVVLEANRTALQFAGIGEQDVVGKPIWETPWWSHSEVLQQQLREAVASAAAGQFVRLEVSHLGADGALRAVDFSLKPVHDDTGDVTLLISEGRDITDRKLLEEQLRQSQKMEAIGQLAGGIAHDFNNLLTIICGCSDLLLLDIDAANNRLRGAVAAIRDAGDRAALLTRQLLAFSRKQFLEPKVLDLNEVVGNSEKLLRRLIGEDILLTTALDPALRQVRVDPGQIEQVVLNLAVNARDAMPRGGRLTITTSNNQLDADYCRNHPDCKPGNYVQLTVNDTGAGMTEAIKSRIFEPFFTTKEQGKGTGLGLSTVYGIIKQSEGHIAVDSEVGLGTTFRVFLPALLDWEAIPAAESNRPVPLGGNETILLVEDEAKVREIVRTALTMAGYNVLEASSGREAIELSASHRGPIHLVVTDLVMPEMSGRELAQHLRRRQPSLKILYMSGYTEDAMVRDGLIAGTDAFLSKPFTPLVLAKKVRQALSGDNSPPA